MCLWRIISILHCTTLVKVSVYVVIPSNLSNVNRLKDALFKRQGISYYSTLSLSRAFGDFFAFRHK